jgi:hypothetical protein
MSGPSQAVNRNAGMHRPCPVSSDGAQERLNLVRTMQIAMRDDPELGRPDIGRRQDFYQVEQVLRLKIGQEAEPP